MDEQNKNLKELLSGLTQADFEKDVDLHMHSCFSDGRLTPDELLEDAKKKGYRLIAIADHNTVEGYKKTNILESGMVLTAIEFDCWFRGVLVHILGYGVDINNSELLSYCAKNKKETEADIVRLLNHRHPKDVIKAIHNAGGLAVLAHPACYWAVNLEHFVKGLIELGLDGIESYYPYRRHRGIIKFHTAESVRRIGRKYGLIMTGGSDSHSEIEGIG
ncbi:MAG: PHP domain-containing protein [Clostridium sp.]|nr:PHP domain-containing protein [Clostridium sp.]